MPFGWLHDPLVAIAKLGTVAFFSRIHIEGADEVPQEGDGPFLALANHWNSAVDVSQLRLKLKVRMQVEGAVV